MGKAKKLPSGNFRARAYDYTDNKGIRHYKSFTAESKKQAEYLATEYEINHSHSVSSYEDLTLEEAYQRYIDSKSSVLSPSTINGYKKCKRNDFKMLMPMRLHKITPQIIQTAVNEMSANYAPKSVRNSYGLLSAVMRTYCPNINMSIRLPQKVTPEYNIPTTEDINKLLSEADELIRVPILLASSGSLRRSEICALTPEDISDTGIMINKAAVYDENNNIIIKPPKTSAGRRFVPLSKKIISEVRAWNYFGCTPTRLSNAFCSLIDKCDVPHFSFHKLRHYFASELHYKGVPDKEIARIGGWETLDVLHNIYQHTLRNHQKEFDEKITDIFSDNFSESI